MLVDASSARVRFAEGVCFQSLGTDSDGVLLSMQTGQLYRCNPVATVYLEALTIGESLEHAVGEIVDRFEVDEPIVYADLMELVSDLVNRELLEAA